MSQGTLALARCCSRLWAFAAILGAAWFTVVGVSPAGAQVDYSNWTVAKWIANAADPWWSPDGQHMTLTRKVSVGGKTYDHIFLANGDGSNPVDLMPDWTSQNDTANWSADGQKIVWVSDKGAAFDIGGAGGGPGVDVWVMNADGSAKTKVTTSTPGGVNYRPYWSHNGRRLLWTQGWWQTNVNDFRWQLHTADYVDDAQGGHLENVATLNQPDTAFYEGSEWTPDDSGIIYSSTKSNSGNYELYRLNLTTGQEQRLTFNPEIDISGHPSPDGSWIAFTSSRDDHSTWSYYTDVSWDLNLPPLYDNIVTIIAETAIAWLQPVNPQGTDIYLMRPDGSGVTQITQWQNQVGGGWPAWAPDGCHLATAPAIAQQIANQRQLIDTTKQQRDTYLITFAGCSPLP